MNTKGISPLIATVLIIGFTVALAAIIITWGGRFISDVQEDVDVSTEVGLACSKLNFEITDVVCSGTGLCKDLDGGTVQCTSNGDCGIGGTCSTGTCLPPGGSPCNSDLDCGINFCDVFGLDLVKVKSFANQDIASFIIRATDSNGVQVDNTGTIGVGKFGAEDIPYAGLATDPFKVEAIARVNVGGVIETCQAGIEELSSATSLCS